MLKKVVILAGGLGTCLSEETERRPKPMVEIGGRPNLWHIIKIHLHYGVNEFVIWSVASRRRLAAMAAGSTAVSSLCIHVPAMGHDYGRAE
jgi:dTDP-glucose pyrophosphorylase